MKRLLVITHAGGSPHHGPNMRWYYLGQALKEIGVEVEIVSSSFFHKYVSPPDLSGSLETSSINGLTYHWLRTSPYKNRGLSQVFNQIEFVFRCYQFARFFASRKPDLVIASSPHPFIIFPARYIASITGVEFIFEVRDLWPELLVQLGAFSRWHPYVVALSFAERLGVKNSKFVISVKPGDGDYFYERYGLQKSRFYYIPNGFLPSDLESPISEEIKQLRDRYKLVIGYVGALSLYYGLDHLVNLAHHFRSTPEVGFIVVGGGDQLNRLRARVYELGMQNVHFVGSIPNPAVPSALAFFDCCYVGLQDIDVHNFGISCNKIYEYMYAGKPIIGSYRTEYDPVLEAKCGFVAPPGDYQPLIDGINLLITDPDLASTLGQRGRSFFNLHHDFTIIAQRLKIVLFPGNDKLQLQDKLGVRSR